MAFGINPRQGGPWLEATNDALGFGARADVGDLDPLQDDQPAMGLENGQAAQPNRIVINPGSESEQIKGGGLNQLASDEVLVNDTGGGGGGWGNPFERDPAAVAADVRNGFVSVGAARADYGVIVDEHTFEVDATATADARAAVG
jgi:N-methylhydantoinase B/oxoprolinase/acetone carboxylase alpha subunit